MEPDADAPDGVAATRARAPAVPSPSDPDDAALAAAVAELRRALDAIPRLDPLVRAMLLGHEKKKGARLTPNAPLETLSKVHKHENKDA